jgi:ABC-2 type transport system permease protein
MENNFKRKKTCQVLGDTMNAFLSALWAEALKAYKSGIIWVSFAAVALMPLVDGFFMIILKNPEQARQMGLIGAKAQLAAGTADWPTFYYVLLMGSGIAGMILFAFLTAWVFGREFSDHTLKEWLALPTSRATIVAAKLILITVWIQVLALWIFGLGFAIGGAVDIPGGSSALNEISFWRVMSIAFMIDLLMPWVAFIAGVGRGYLLPIAWAFVTMAAAQISVVLGWGEWFPWAVPALVAEIAGPKGGSIGAHSLVILCVAGMAGIAATVVWWRSADQAK